MLRAAQLDARIEESKQRLGIPRFNLGVLLVHGLGDQVRGDTLTVQGDPIIDWLRSRVGQTGQPGDARVDVLDVVARQSSADTIPNPHAVIRITPPATGDPPKAPDPTYWVVAEAYWAENFRQATFSEFIGWWLWIGPWVFATQLAGIYRRMEIRADVGPLMRLGLVAISIIAGVAFAAVAAALAFLMFVAAGLVLIGAYLPIPFIASAARSFQRTLANGFGDAYVLSRSPVRFGAMAAEVRTGLEVLRQKADAVAVIAESQGTAVAWYGLKHNIVDVIPQDRQPEEPPAPIGLFLTHAQGLRKLTFALAMARGEETGRHIAIAAGLALLVGVVLASVLLGAPLWLLAVGALAALVVEGYLIRWATGIWDDSAGYIKKDWQEVLDAGARTPATPETPKLEWLDLWASADPATVGPLGVDADGIESFKIRNIGSSWADHVAYWRNRTEFLPIVTAKLFRLGGPAQYAIPADDPQIEVPALRRHARVVALIPFRIVVVLGVALGLVHLVRIPRFGSGVLEWAHSLNLPFLDFLDRPPDWLVVVTGLVLVVGVGLLLWLAVSLSWNALMSEDEKTFFRGVRRPLWTAGWYLFGGLLVAIEVVIVSLLLLVDEPMLAAAHPVAALFLTMLGIVILASGGKTFANTEALDRTFAGVTKITGGKWSSWVAAVVLAAVVVAIPTAAFVWARDLFPAVLGAVTLLLSAVLAVEGVRKYQLFRECFGGRNAKLPEEA